MLPTTSNIARRRGAYDDDDIEDGSVGVVRTMHTRHNNNNSGDDRSKTRLWCGRWCGHWRMYRRRGLSAACADDVHTQSSLSSSQSLWRWIKAIMLVLICMVIVMTVMGRQSPTYVYLLPISWLGRWYTLTGQTLQWPATYAWHIPSSMIGTFGEGPTIVPTDVMHTFNAVNDSMTIQLWMKLDDTNGGLSDQQGEYCMVSHARDWGRWKLSYARHAIYVALKLVDGRTIDIGTPSVSSLLLGSGRWHHISMTVDSPRSIVSIYIDGMEVHRTILSHTPLVALASWQSVTVPPTIGICYALRGHHDPEPNRWGAPFPGWIANIQIVPRVLSSQEIYQSMFQLSPSSPSSSSPADSSATTLSTLSSSLPYIRAYGPPSVYAPSLSSPSAYPLRYMSATRFLTHPHSDLPLKPPSSKHLASITVIIVMDGITDTWRTVHQMLADLYSPRAPVRASQLIIVELQPDVIPRAIPSTVYLATPTAKGTTTALHSRPAQPLPAARDLRRVLLPNDSNDGDGDSVWLTGVDIHIARVTETVTWSTAVNLVVRDLTRDHDWIYLLHSSIMVDPSTLHQLFIHRNDCKGIRRDDTTGTSRGRPCAALTSRILYGADPPVIRHIGYEMKLSGHIHGDPQSWCIPVHRYYGAPANYTPALQLTRIHAMEAFSVLYNRARLVEVGLWDPSMQPYHHVDLSLRLNRKTVSGPYEMADSLLCIPTSVAYDMDALDTTVIRRSGWYTPAAMHHRHSLTTGFAEDVTSIGQGQGYLTNGETNQGVHLFARIWTLPLQPYYRVASGLRIQYIAPCHGAAATQSVVILPSLELHAPLRAMMRTTNDECHQRLPNQWTMILPSYYGHTLQRLRYRAFNDGYRPDVVIYSDRLESIADYLPANVSLHIVIRAHWTARSSFSHAAAAILHRVNDIWISNEYDLQLLRTIGLGASQKLHFVPPAIDTDLISNTSITPLISRASADEFVFVALCPLSTPSLCDALIAAYAHEFRSNDTVRLVLYTFTVGGDGTWIFDNNHRPTITNMMQSASDQRPSHTWPAIHIITHQLDSMEMIALYASADVLVWTANDLRLPGDSSSWPQWMSVDPIMVPASLSIPVLLHRTSWPHHTTNTRGIIIESLITTDTCYTWGTRGQTITWHQLASVMRRIHHNHDDVRIKGSAARSLVVTTRHPSVIATTMVRLLSRVRPRRLGTDAIVTTTTTGHGHAVQSNRPAARRTLLHGVYSDDVDDTLRMCLAMPVVPAAIPAPALVAPPPSTKKSKRKKPKATGTTSSRGLKSSTSDTTPGIVNENTNGNGNGNGMVNDDAAVGEMDDHEDEIDGDGHDDHFDKPASTQMDSTAAEAAELLRRRSQWPTITDIDDHSVTEMRHQTGLSDNATLDEQDAIIRIAIISSYPPRKCGVGTFMDSLLQGIEFAASQRGATVGPAFEFEVIPLLEHYESLPTNSSHHIALRRGLATDLFTVAEYINNGFSAVLIQHEFGLYGGSYGGHIICLARLLAVPIVVTFHTLHDMLGPSESIILRQLWAASHRSIAMTQLGYQYLHLFHGIGNDDGDARLGPHDGSKAVIIPHGVTHYDRSLPSDSDARRIYDWHDRVILLSTGLIQPDKGFQTVIHALPLLIQRIPTLLYVIAGEVHRDSVYSAAYVEDLHALIQRLGVSDHVMIINRFLTTSEQVDLIRACDFFIAAYTNSFITSSGTTSTAMSLGRVVIATPFAYAREVLGGGRGVIFGFQDYHSLATIIHQLYHDTRRCDDLRNHAYAYAQSVTWPIVGKQYLRVLQQAATVYHTHS